MNASWEEFATHPSLNDFSFYWGQRSLRGHFLSESQKYSINHFLYKLHSSMGLHGIHSFGIKGH